MFELGTKIVVLSSTSTDKFGPRRGSIGYVSFCSNAYVYKFIGPSVTISRIDLLLTRYGFGKEKETAERCVVMALLPFFPTTDAGNIGLALDNYIKAFHKEANNPKLMYFKSQLGLPKETATVILAPSNIHTLNIMSLNETNFQAWFRAVTSNLTLRTALNQLGPLHMKKVDKSLLPYILSLRSIVSSKKAKRNLTKIMLKEKSEKHKLIKALKVFSLSARTKEALNQKRFVAHGFKIGKYVKKDHLMLDVFFREATKNFFRDDVFEHNMNLVREYCNGKQDPVCERLELTRIALRKRATKLFNIRNNGRAAEVLRPVK
jgi:hypothetical protein